MNSPRSFSETCLIMPLPNWATLPEIVRSVSTMTRVPTGSGRRSAVIRADALPGPAGVLALGIDHGMVRRVVLGREPGGAAEVADHRSELDPDLALVDLTVEPGQARARHTGRDRLEIGQYRPGLRRWHAHGELVGDLHAVPSLGSNSSAIASRSSGVLAIADSVRSASSRPSDDAPSTVSAETQSIVSASPGALSRSSAAGPADEVGGARDQRVGRRPAPGAERSVPRGRVEGTRSSGRGSAAGARRAARGSGSR